MKFGMIMYNLNIIKKKKTELCYMHTDSFIVSIKTDDIYKDLAEDSGKRFDTSNYELEKPLPKGKNKNVIGLMKDELRREMMTKFVGLRAKGYSQLIDDGYLMQSIRFV